MRVSCNEIFLRSTMETTLPKGLTKFFVISRVSLWLKKNFFDFILAVITRQWLTFCRVSFLVFFSVDPSRFRCRPFPSSRRVVQEIKTIDEDVTKRPVNTFLRRDPSTRRIPKCSVLLVNILVTFVKTDQASYLGSCIEAAVATIPKYLNVLRISPEFIILLLIRGLNYDYASDFSVEVKKNY